MASRLVGGLAGVWVKRGAVWLLTTRGRPQGTQEVLDACEATGMTSQGVVWVDKGPKIEQYKRLRLPSNWRMEFAPRWGGLALGQEWCLREYPQAWQYGWLADDTFPRTKGWDKRLERAAGRWHLAYARDLWLSEIEDARERLQEGALLSSGLCHGGDLVRAAGFWALPDAMQAGHDTAWVKVIEPFRLHRYMSKVIVEHKNWRTGNRPKDENDWFDHAGVATRDKWVNSPHFIATTERIREGLNLASKAPYFSIILATRNRQELLDRAVASILAQTRTDWELIVTDNSDEKQTLPADKRIRHYFVKPSNIPDLYNQALAKAQGTIISTLADDDYYAPDALEVVGQNIGDANWLVAATVIENEGGHPQLSRGGTWDCVERTRAGTYMLGGAIYWRKTLSDEVGDYSAAYDGAGDFHLYVRFIKHSNPVVIPNVLYHYMDWPGTDSNQRVENQRYQSSRIAQGA